MLMEDERKLITEYGKKMISSGLTTGTAGNISICDRKSGLMAITPSGIDYFEETPEDIVVMDLEGNIVEGNRKPSSEHHLHSVMYKIKQGINSVVHTHSMYCTVLSCLNVPIEAVHYVLADTGTATVPVAPYKLYGTEELAEAVGKTIGKGNAVLMANHGMLACGSSLSAAFGLAKTCEWTAEIQWKCMCAGKPNILSEEQMNEVIKKFSTYGQTVQDESSVKGYFA